MLNKYSNTSVYFCTLLAKEISPQTHLYQVLLGSCMQLKNGYVCMVFVVGCIQALGISLLQIKPYALFRRYPLTVLLMFVSKTSSSWCACNLSDLTPLSCMRATFLVTGNIEKDSKHAVRIHEPN